MKSENRNRNDHMLSFYGLWQQYVFGVRRLVSAYSSNFKWQELKEEAKIK